MSVENNPELLRVSFTLLFCDWFKKLAPSIQPIRCKINANSDLVTRVFPRFRPVICIYFDFSLALPDLYFCSDWPCNYFNFDFTTINQKAPYCYSNQHTNPSKYEELHPWRFHFTLSHFIVHLDEQRNQEKKVSTQKHKTILVPRLHIYINRETIAPLSNPYSNQ